MRARNRLLVRLRAALGVGLAGALLVGSAAPAAAIDYPSWAEVEAARTTATSKAAEVDRLRGLITQLEAETTAAQAAADQRADEYEQAQNAADQANLAHDALAEKVADAGARAERSAKMAGQLSAAMARTGGADLNLKLFLDSANASDVLNGLGSTMKLTEYSNELLEAATSDRNTAQSLSDQAEVAATVRKKLAAQAETALQLATETAAQSAAALQAQSENQAVLQSQLAVLIENRAATEADYATGERERARLAEEAAARTAAARAAAGALSGGGTDSGQLSNQGWTKPVAGRITSGFGPRLNAPVAGVNPYHYATDLGAGCDATVRAATAGTVIYSGWLGTYGNWVLIDHGDGIQTGYAHNRNGGLLVSVGQTVTAGQPVALVGSTGASSGCHSHFEVRTNGTRTNPVPFMQNRGVTLG